MTTPNDHSVEPSNQESSRAMEIFGNIFTAPSKAMSQVQEKYSIAFPLILMALLTGSVLFSYYSVVDYPWLVDYLVESTAGELSKAEQDQTRAGLEMMSPTVMGVISAITVMVMTAVIYLIQAVYFLIVSNITNDGYEFKQWLSFVSWTAIPGVLAILAMFAYMLSSANGQLPPDSLNQLSLNELIFGLDASKGLGKLLSTIHLAQFWSFAVMIIGYQIWTKKSTMTSATIVLSPFVLFYIGWYLLFI